jgi:methyl-accepting chemotaxis protein
MKPTRDLLHPLYVKADRLMLAVVWSLFGFSCLLASDSLTWPAVGWIGLPTALVASVLVRWRAGALLTRLYLAASLMVFAALQIHQAHGLTELHFGVFVLMAFLLAYRDWRPIVCAAIVIALHHLSFNYLQIGGLAVYCFTRPSFSTVLTHAGYVVAEAGLLIKIAMHMKADAMAGSELALLGANLSREEGKFDLRLAPMTLTGLSSRTFKATLDAIHLALQQVSAIVDQMAESSEDIAAENHALFQEIQTQANGLKDSNQTIMQIAQRIRSSAEHAATANGLARDTSEVARESGKVVSDVVGKMSQIDQAVQRMGEMIAAIEGIAFQTNILAINASVEAARAGSSGRGFSVVAAEVRTLAQRSASAARDIKNLIADSLQKVGEGSALATQAGVAMAHVVEKVGSVAELIDRVSSASDAQSSDVDRFCQGIDEMDSALGSNVEHVKNVASASGSMHEKAHTLRTAISAFLVERGELRHS